MGKQFPEPFWRKLDLIMLTDLLADFSTDGGDGASLAPRIETESILASDRGLPGRGGGDGGGGGDDRSGSRGHGQWP